MPSDIALTAIDLLLRGGVCLLLLLVAGMLSRDYNRAVPARLSALFAAGTAAYATFSAPAVQEIIGSCTVLIAVLASANYFVLWLFAKALFDDGFQPRSWHGGICGVLAIHGLIAGLASELSPDAAALSSAVL